MAHMENILEVYKRPYDPKRPVICMDESPKQLISEIKEPIKGKPGSVEKYDYETNVLVFVTYSWPMSLYGERDM